MALPNVSWKSGSSVSLPDESVVILLQVPVDRN